MRCASADFQPCNAGIAARHFRRTPAAFSTAWVSDCGLENTTCSCRRTMKFFYSQAYARRWQSASRWPFQRLRRSKYCKVNCARIALEIGLPHPEAHVVTDAHELDAWSNFPRFVKLDYGTAGQTVQLHHDRVELDKALAAFREQGWWADGTPILLQRPASGTQGFVRGLYRHGKLVASHASRAPALTASAVPQWPVCRSISPL